MFGLHGGRAPGACDRASAGRRRAAQGRAEDAAGCHTQQVGAWHLDEALRIFASHQVFRSFSIWPRFGVGHQRPGLDEVLRCLRTREIPPVLKHSVRRLLTFKTFLHAQEPL